MKLAVIDCGTNTFNLIIVRVESNGKYSKIYHSREAVKLGEGTINGGYIDDQPFQRGVAAIERFCIKMREECPDKVLAFATSAIRDGRNGSQFVETIRKQFGIALTVIHGDREADLVYSAVRAAVKLGQEVSLIMDIGGGSTEFILANAERIFWKQSFLLGAARLLDGFRPSDRITPDQVAAIRDHLAQQLQPLAGAARLYPPAELVGSSGAFESFVEMIHTELGGEPFDQEKTCYEIELGSYRRISDLIIASNMEERRRIKGLVPMRYDMIVICCIMVDFVLERFGLGRMRMSAWSLKEGAMVEFVKQYAASDYGQDTSN